MKTTHALVFLALVAADEPNCDGNLPRAPAGEHGVDRNGVAYDNPTPTSSAGDVSVSVGVSVGTGGVNGGATITVPITPPAAQAPPD